MTSRYQDVYPEGPEINSEDLGAIKASELLTLEFFQAAPAQMPHEIFSQHHILINLREEPTRVENWRGTVHRDFIFHKNEIIVTPAGLRSGWKWYERSKVIVITLEPDRFEKFAQWELGILLRSEQLQDIPQFIDEDITQSAIMLMDALESPLGSQVMFESYARIFLTKLIQKYGTQDLADLKFSQSFTAAHYKRVLDYIHKEFGNEVNIETMSSVAGLSTAHFSRSFKQTIGQSPHQFVMSYRIEQAKKM
ncbi:MAG: AraC family transcriptional regulator, partial [Verrucomicrobiota bacterium]